MKVSNIWFIIAAVLFLILIAPYIAPLPMSVVEIQIVGVKVFAKDVSERTAIFLFSSIVCALIGIYLRTKGK